MADRNKTNPLGKPSEPAPDPTKVFRDMSPSVVGATVDEARDETLDEVRLLDLRVKGLQEDLRAALDDIAVLKARSLHGART